MPADQLTTTARPDADVPGPVPRRDSDWAQVNITFTSWPDAAQVVDDHLRDVVPSGRWWFIRKHPHWRLRHHPDDFPRLARRLDTLTRAGVLHAWHTSTYEPETHAFGGPAAMRVAHELFCHDSPTALALTLPGSPLASGRRTEVSVLAITRMLRGAALEPYEQGDVWAQLATLRGADTTSQPTAARTGTAMHRLLTLDTGPASTLVSDGPLTPLRNWLDGFSTAGRHLAALHHTGRLHRGLRAVLAYHVIFHWNRIGLSTAHQAALARLARDTLIPAGTPDRTLADPAHGRTPIIEEAIRWADA